MTIKFSASLQGAGCLRFDDDGASVIKLTISANELPNAVKMVMMKGKEFTVTIEDKNEPETNHRRQRGSRSLALC